MYQKEGARMVRSPEPIPLEILAVTLGVQLEEKEYLERTKVLFLTG